MTAIERAIEVALQEEGYYEKSKAACQNNPSVLDSKNQGIGADNMTKYGRDMVKWVGSPYAQGVAWCDEWVDWVMVTAFGIDKAKEMIGGWSAYTPTSAQYYKNMGRWRNVPEVGAQIFFQNSTRINHTGIVYKVDDTKVYTIEGNTSSTGGVVVNGGCVAKKTYLKTNTKIAGYGMPKYELAETTKPYLYKGIDVSAAQKNMDYNAIKNAGIDFAILKIIRKDLNKDVMFENHYAGFTSVGVPIFCVYNYSYAATVDKARSDAKMVIKHLEGRRLAVCLDVEDSVQKGLGKLLIDIINAYQEVIEEAGLPFILYTGMYFYNSFIKPFELKLKCKDIWMARYYKGDAPMTFPENPDEKYKPIDNLVGWQYTSKGKMSGYNGDLDFDVIYRDIKAPGAAPKRIMATVSTKGSKLNVRDYPKTGSVIDKLSNGSKIIIQDIKDGWYMLGPDRYVCGDYVKSDTLGTIIAYKLNIRSSDSTKGTVVGTYLKDEIVPIMAQSSTGWYLTPKGWISNNYVKL
jgi:GH25 family lysozyme M1 (1,4-beta-N-acetylmuramidase)